MDKKEFKIEFKDKALAGDIWGDATIPSLLFLHGAGTSHHKRFDPLRNYLAEREIGSVAFDFIGHGDTGGELRSSSLKERLEETETVIRKLNLLEPLSLVGASMGAYVAVKLTAIFNVKNLILAVPAMYDRKAYDVPFDKGFTEIIRQPNSWENSDGFDLLKKFRGNLLVLVAGKDDVIPKELIERIDRETPNVRSREFVAFPEATHKILGHLAENPSTFQIAAEKIATLMK